MNSQGGVEEAEAVEVEVEEAEEIQTRTNQWTIMIRGTRHRICQ
jgi:hypothetical protein